MSGDKTVGIRNELDPISTEEIEAFMSAGVLPMQLAAVDAVKLRRTQGAPS